MTHWARDLANKWLRAADGDGSLGNSLTLEACGDELLRALEEQEMLARVKLRREFADDPEDYIEKCYRLGSLARDFWKNAGKVTASDSESPRNAYVWADNHDKPLLSVIDVDRPMDAIEGALLAMRPDFPLNVLATVGLADYLQACVEVDAAHQMLQQPPPWAASLAARWRRQGGHCRYFADQLLAAAKGDPILDKRKWKPTPAETALADCEERLALQSAVLDRVRDWADNPEDLEDLNDVLKAVGR